MTTETFEMDKSNWTGEKATLTVTDGVFEVHGNKFRIETSEDPLNDGGRYDVTLAKVISVDGSWAHPLAKGAKFKMDNYWVFSAMGVERQDANPYVAAAQVLFNII